MIDSSETREIFHQYFNGYLQDLLQTFNFTRPGRDRSLGLDAAHIVGEGIIDRTISKQRAADGTNFPRNNPKYNRMKRAKYSSTIIGVRTGQMLSPTSVLGKIELSPLLVLIRYGTGSAPPPAPNPVFPDDEDVTDTEKAEYFTTKKGAWFEPDDEIAGRVRDMFVSELQKFIDQLNALS